MPQVDTNVPGGGQGPNQAEPQGAAQQFAADSHAIQSIGANPMQGGPPGAPGPGGPPPQSLPAAGGPPGPSGPTQPLPQQPPPGRSQQANFSFDPNIARRLQGDAPWRHFLVHLADTDPNLSGGPIGEAADRVRHQMVKPK